MWCNWLTPIFQIQKMKTMYTATTDTSKKIPQNSKRYRKGVEFATSAVFTIPNGYMTGDEFEKRVITRLEKSYKERGLL